MKWHSLPHSHLESPPHRFVWCFVNTVVVQIQTGLLMWNGVESWNGKNYNWLSVVLFIFTPLLNTHPPILSFPLVLSSSSSSSPCVQLHRGVITQERELNKSCGFTALQLITQLWAYNMVLSGVLNTRNTSALWPPHWESQHIKAGSLSEQNHHLTLNSLIILTLTQPHPLVGIWADKEQNSHRVQYLKKAVCVQLTEITQMCAPN